MDFERPVDSRSFSSEASSDPSIASSNRDSNYDFDRLERSIESLLTDHERLSNEHEALISELVERQQRIKALEAELVLERGRRAKAVGVIDRVLSRVESIEASIRHDADDPGSLAVDSVPTAGRSEASHAQPTVPEAR